VQTHAAPQEVWPHSSILPNTARVTELVSECFNPATPSTGRGSKAKYSVLCPQRLIAMASCMCGGTPLVEHVEADPRPSNP
jgi:hypothetical protein